MSFQNAIIANKLAEQINGSYVHKFAFQMTCLQMDVIKTICKEKNITIEQLSIENIFKYYKEHEITQL
jgi:hypothetical protein